MTPEITKYLAQDRPGDFHDKLLSHIKNLTETSRDRIKKYYPQWKAVDYSFRSMARIDSANKEAVRREKKAEERSEPGKFVLPIGHTQIDTFVSFCYQMFTQKDVIFELEGVGLEDTLSAPIAEQAVEFDLNHSNFRGPVLQQFLTDIARYSFGVFKYGWVDETNYYQQPVTAGTMGVEGLAPVQTIQTVPEQVFQGNKIVNVSAYRFLPDPRIPLFRFQDGEFCGDEDFVTYNKLVQQESEGVIAGLQYVQKIGAESISSGRDFPFDPSEIGILTKNVVDSPYILTEMQVVINPANFLKDVEGHGLLGKENYPCKFLFWMLNDNRIVRIERLDYPKQRFTYSVGILKPDAENFLGLSLYDVIGSLQDTADWLINSRVTAVRKNINLDMVVDPSAIEVEDLKARRSVLRLTRAAQGTDVRRYIYQMSRSDNTASNITDTEFLHKYAKEGTGLTDNLIGQFASGRRSAREASQVQNNATNRIKTAASGIWLTGMKPLGEDILANLRAGLTMQRMLKMTGVPNNPEKTLAGAQQFVSATKADIAGNYDFRVFDGTLPSDRQAQAAALQELAMAGFQNPQLFMLLQINPQLLFEELMELRGIKNVSRFRLTPAQISQFAQVLGLSGNQGTPEGNQGPQDQNAGGPSGPGGITLGGSVTLPFGGNQGS